MDSRNTKRSSSSERKHVPKVYNIPKATEPGFNIDTCMNDFKIAGDTFEHDSDYYFDSYSHFSIHEEMLKDRVKNKNLFLSSRPEPLPTKTPSWEVLTSLRERSSLILDAEPVF